jgi:hypothetical protein
MFLLRIGGKRDAAATLTYRLPTVTLDNDQLNAQILIHLLGFSICTCFEQYLAYPQEVKLY